MRDDGGFGPRYPFKLLRYTIAQSFRLGGGLLSLQGFGVAFDRRGEGDVTESIRWPWRRLFAALCTLGVLAVLPYVRSVSLPLISDDYLVIGLSKEFGPVPGWGALLSDPLYRNRATSMVLTWWIYLWAGVHAWPYYACGVLLHVVNTWLIFALGRLPYAGWRLAGLTAAFFAVYEGHQEAVIWISAFPELLVFLFGLLTLHFWWSWLEGRIWCYYAALLSFLLALLSKESGVVFTPLLLTPLLEERYRQQSRRLLLRFTPFLLLTLGYVALVFAGKHENQHFGDGTFSLHAPFWITIPHSIGRMLWIWGVPSLVALIGWRPRGWKVLTGIVFGWMALTLLPYSFLTYMTRVPSRHTYLASAGLALLVAFAFSHTTGRFQQTRRWIPAALGALLISHNCLYVWLYKHQHYVKRAAPTEELIRVVAASDGPVFVQSFPYHRVIAEYAIEMMTGKPKQVLVFDPSQRDSAVRLYAWRD
jgi:hypothetical protein